MQIPSPTECLTWCSSVLFDGKLIIDINSVRLLPQGRARGARLSAEEDPRGAGRRPASGNCDREGLISSWLTCYIGEYLPPPAKKRKQAEKKAAKKAAKKAEREKEAQEAKKTEGLEPCDKLPAPASAPVSVLGAPVTGAISAGLSGSPRK